MQLLLGPWCDCTKTLDLFTRPPSPCKPAGPPQPGGPPSRPNSGRNTQKRGEVWEEGLPLRGTHKPPGSGSTRGQALLPIHLALPIRSLPFDPWVVMRVHGWPRTLMSGHVVTWLRSPSRPCARLQGCRPQTGHTVSAPLLLLEGLLPPNPRALRTPIPPPRPPPQQTLPASPRSLPGC